MMNRIVPVLLLPLVLGSACGKTGEEGGGGGAGGGGSPLPRAPSLTAARARAVGRAATTLRLDVEGADAQGDASGVQVRLLGATGTDVPFFDNDFDGLPESADAYLPFDVPVAAAGEFSAVVTLADVPPVPADIAFVDVTIVDAAGNASDTVHVAAVLPPERALGQACDPAYVEDRCAVDLGCKGTPATCQPPEAPSITRLGYLLPDDVERAGPRLLVEGTEPDDDLAVLHVELLDADGNPVSIDLDGDEIADASTFDVDGVGRAVGGRFLVALDMGLGLQDAVQRVAAVPEDSGGRQGPRVETTLAPVPVRQLGQSCSEAGFERCTAGAVCAPTVAGNALCQSEAGLRSQQCAAAPVVEVAAGRASIIGVADGASVWDAPPGCASNDPVGRAEAVVLVRLTVDAAVLRLSTATPHTAFDTTLYVLPACLGAGDSALACVDDGEQTVASTLELRGVAAGTYAVIVDSFLQGGTFGLDIEVE